MLIAVILGGAVYAEPILKVQFWMEIFSGQCTKQILVRKSISVDDVYASDRNRQIIPPLRISHLIFRHHY